jgi:hypothetical protein
MKAAQRDSFSLYAIRALAIVSRAHLIINIAPFSLNMS